jgi:hypothetical protein
VLTALLHVYLQLLPTERSGERSMSVHRCRTCTRAPAIGVAWSAEHAVVCMDAERACSIYSA